MKCLLHIGTEKTGTSIVQDWLYDNKKALSNTGVYLSKNLGKPKNRLFSAYFEDGWDDDWAKSNGVRNKTEKKRYFTGFIERLTQEVIKARRNHDVFVITSEHLHSRVIKRNNIKKLHNYLKSVFNDIEVVCYFRDQFDVAVSLYSTAMKLGGKASIEQFVDNAKPEAYYYNYLKIADNWAEVFGKQNCNFRIYDRSKFINNDIRLDFLDVMDIDVDLSTMKMDRRSSNQSLHLLQASAFRAVNRNVPYWRQNNGGVNRDNISLKASILNTDALKIGRVVSKKGEIVRSRFHRANKKFFEKYFPDRECFPVSSVQDDCTVAYHDAANAVEVAFEIALKVNADNISSLTEAQIDALRDIALRLYDFDASEDALTLMKIALNQRPHGPLIKNRVKQWSAKVNAGLRSKKLPIS